MTNKENITDKLALAFRSVYEQIEQEDVSFLIEWIEKPAQESHGDYAFPCFRLAKTLRENPANIAKKVAAKIEGFEVEAVGGYINFKVDLTRFAKNHFPDIITGKDFEPKSFEEETEGILVEYSQLNTHKAMHIGHARCAAIGDTLTRMIKQSGKRAIPSTYIGDEGSHVAKCLWYLMKFSSLDELAKHEQKGEQLGLMYTKAANLLDLSTYTKVPNPSIEVAKVQSIKKLPSNDELSIVRLNTKKGELEVICGGKGYDVNSKVAFCPSGSKLNERFIGEKDYNGVVSHGVICSEQELKISDDKDQIAVLDENCEVGAPVAKFFPLPGYEGKDFIQDLQVMETEVSDVLRKLESNNAEIMSIWKKTKEWSMDDFRVNHDWLNCSFEDWGYESEFGDSGKELVRQFLEQDIFVKSDGAIGADLSTFDLGFCIFIKTDGTATYACRDLALARSRFEQQQLNQIIYVVDSAQSLHFKQVFKSLDLMKFSETSSCSHYSYEAVVLRGKNGKPEKMSSRKGNIVLFSDLKDQITKMIMDKFLHLKRNEWTGQEIQRTCDLIALATIRYGMLKQSGDAKIAFDLNEWLDTKGNTGPYLLYTYARVKSIERKVGRVNWVDVDYEVLRLSQELDVIRSIMQYSEVFEKATTSLQPHIICTYLFEHASKINSMYHECPVANAENKKLCDARASLLLSASKILEHGLDLLGIKTAERL
ncbi:MAG: arginine--tRNA ligase [Verrucomicrobiota bacterium]